MGTNLLIPDCELSSMRTIDAFYSKQIAFAFTVPCIVLVSVVSWSIIGCTCARSKKCTKKIVTYKQIKNFVILSIVLMLFLAFPMLVKICLSTLKCPFIGDHMYLMADLQEECFVGRHAMYILLLTLPEFIFIVLGLPAIAGWIIVRAKDRYVSGQGGGIAAHLKVDDDGRKKSSSTGIQKIPVFQSYDFRMRYGLLYLGYRSGREWWEVVIALRKVSIVAVGTFGTLMGLVDIQAFVALAVVFVAIILHLVGEPFDTKNKHLRVLHYLEFSALTVCWGTFWGGLLFYLGAERPNSVPNAVRVVLTVILLAANVIFLFAAIRLFSKHTILDFREKFKHRRKSRTEKPDLQEMQEDLQLIENTKPDAMPPLDATPDVKSGFKAGEKQKSSKVVPVNDSARTQTQIMTENDARDQAAESAWSVEKL